MKIENTRVFNFDGAFRGMRNPKNSWDKSDSILDYYSDTTQSGRRVELINRVASTYNDFSKAKIILSADGYDVPFQNGIIKLNLIGKNDLTLALSLIKAGSEHRKFLRQIFISADFTLGLEVWKEFDTYKVGTVSNSCSTMHKIASKPFTIEDFEMGDYHLSVDDKYFGDTIIPHLEELRLKFIETNDKKYWRELIRALPESYLQKRTITMNYENAMNIYNQRKNHKLHQWSNIDSYLLEEEYGFPIETMCICDWIEMLPYMSLFLGIDKLD